MKNKSNYPQWLIETATIWFYSLGALEKSNVSASYKEQTNQDLNQVLTLESIEWLLENFNEEIIYFTNY